MGTGRPLGAKNFNTKVQEALEAIADGNATSYEELLIKKVIRKCVVDGDTRMIIHLWDQLNGKPMQRVATVVKGEITHTHIAKNPQLAKIIEEMDLKITEALTYGDTDDTEETD